MDCGVISFGKHRGLPASEVPFAYLAWATRTMAAPPACILDELRRRASLHGTRDSLPAQAALSGHWHRSARKSRMLTARPRRRRKAVEIVGRGYGPGRAAWLASGGDARESPF